MAKNIKSILGCMGIVILLTLSLVLALNENKVIVTRNQLQNQYHYQNQYQLSTGENIGVKITPEQVKEQVRERIGERLRIQDCDCENIQIVEMKIIKIKIGLLIK